MPICFVTVASRSLERPHKSNIGKYLEFETLYTSTVFPGPSALPVSQVLRQQVSSVVFICTDFGYFCNRYHIDLNDVRVHIHGIYKPLQLSSPFIR